MGDAINPDDVELARFLVTLAPARMRYGTTLMQTDGDYWLILIKRIAVVSKWRFLDDTGS